LQILKTVGRHADGQNLYLAISIDGSQGKTSSTHGSFQDLMPMADEVWEMKTADVRFFGWMYQPRKFIALVTMLIYIKGRTSHGAMKTQKIRVIKERDILDLDTPKIAIRGLLMNLYVYDIGETTNFERYPATTSTSPIKSMQETPLTGTESEQKVAA
jgi:hypothetical protein